MDFNAWFNALPPERQAVLREDKWMLANAAFEAASAAAAAKIQLAEKEAESAKDRLDGLLSFEPNANDVEKLRVALSYAGIAAPESQEELAHRWLSYVRALMRSVSFLDEFRAKAVNDFANEICGDVSTDHQRWLSGIAERYCKKLTPDDKLSTLE